MAPRWARRIDSGRQAILEVLPLSGDLREQAHDVLAHERLGALQLGSAPTADEPEARDEARRERSYRASIGIATAAQASSRVSDASSLSLPWTFSHASGGGFPGSSQTGLSVGRRATKVS